MNKEEVLKIITEENLSWKQVSEDMKIIHTDYKNYFIQLLPYTIEPGEKRILVVVKDDDSNKELYDSSFKEGSEVYEILKPIYDRGYLNSEILL